MRDPARIAALERTGLAGTGPDDAFDRFTELAAAVTGAPFVYVTLVDAERYGLKSSVGLPDDAARSGSVEASFCRYVVGSGCALVVEDARNDERVRDNPAVELLGIAAWAGFPITDPDGMVLGTFCAVDTSPRDWSDLDLHVLAVLAAAVSSEIALVLAQRALESARAELRAAGVSR